MFGRKQGKELEAASALLEQYSKIEETIGAEVANLPITELLEANRELQNAEVAEAMGEQPATPVAKAKKRLDAARAAIDTAARKLEGLRKRLLSTVAQMPEVHTALAPTLAEHNAKVKQSFETEWQAACSAFAKVLGRRAAIEAAIGETMTLPEPTPATVELEPEIARPHLRLAGLRAAIEAAATAYTPPRGAAEIDPYKVFVMRRESRGIPVGALVVDATFPPGTLARFVKIEFAAPWKDPEEAKAANAARVAKLDLEEAERQRLNEANEAESKRKAAERKAYLKSQGIEDPDDPNSGDRPKAPGEWVVRSGYMSQFFSDK